MSPPSKARRKILIIDDDIGQLNRYIEMATRIGLAVDGADTLEKAKAALANVNYQYVLTDIHLSSGRQNSFEGFEILREIKAEHPETIPLAMSADPQIETYRKAIREGAAYFFRKPILSESELQIHLHAATTGSRGGRPSRRRSGGGGLPAHLLEKFPDGLVMPADIRNRARKAAVSDTVPVIIFGETGTGKEEVAKIVHRMRSEAQGVTPFVAINCANLTGDTAVSMLFGHRKGAFTGADETTVGYVGEADGGILFLDEVHALSADCQKRLLLVLNDGSYNRVSDPKTLYSDFQVIVATTKDLDDEVEQGNFLLDLRGRLTGLQIHLKPLRERLEDLPLLIELGLARLGASVPAKVLTALVERCSRYYWQGNIRQLFQVLNVLVTEAFGDECEIRADDLPEFKTMLAPARAQTRGTKIESDDPSVEGVLAMLSDALTSDRPMNDVIDTVEKAIMIEATKRHKSLRGVSAAIGVSRAKLSRMIGGGGEGD